MSDYIVKKNLSFAQKCDWFQLIQSQNVGPVTFFQLLSRFGSAKEAIKNLPVLAQKGGQRKKISVFSKTKAKSLMQEYTDRGINVIAACEDDYPPLLRQIEDPPPLIYTIGKTVLLKKKSFAIVGMRNASVTGKKTAFNIATQLSKNNICIVSGMAKGIDTQAHLGAIDKGTIAVLGSGVDVVYPKDNLNLYEMICQKGVVISELAPGTKPIAGNFPRRNRIISGICRGVLIIEALIKSGSMVTAQMAIDQNRDVFAVPSHPFDDRAAGVNKLIKDGAYLVESANDILEIIQNQKLGLSDNIQNVLQQTKVIEFDEDLLNKLRELIFDMLTLTPIGIDIIVRECNCPVAYVNAALLELELAGRVERHYGQKFSKVI